MLHPPSTAAMHKPPTMSSLRSLAAAHADLSWVKRLTSDPQTAQFQPNKTSRQVRSGHYVLVRPTPLPSPTLIHVSSSLLHDMGLSEATAATDPEFLQFFTGDIAPPDTAAGWGTTWATPCTFREHTSTNHLSCPTQSNSRCLFPFFFLPLLRRTVHLRTGDVRQLSI